jgi:WD40 repeat protein
LPQQKLYLEEMGKRIIISFSQLKLLSKLEGDIPLGSFEGDLYPSSLVEALPDLTCPYSFSLLSGGADGQIAIFDIDHTSPTPEKTYKAISNVRRRNRHAHSKSVSRVSWYPIDTGMFVTSGTDNYLKIWDTNQMKVSQN